MSDSLTAAKSASLPISTEPILSAKFKAFAPLIVAISKA